MIAQRRNREALYSSADYWDSKATDYAGDAVSMWPNNHLNALYHAEQLEFVSTLFPDLEGKSLLDLGCGTGRISRWLARRGGNVTGLDFSEGALEIARSVTEGNNPRFECLSVFDLESKDTYDVIFVWGCVTVACQNRTQLADVMERLFRAVKPGGSILFLEPIHRGPLHRVLNLSVGEFREVMYEAGFEIKTVRTLHFWPVRIMLAYVPWPALITRPLYWIGQFMMRIPGLRKLGDYHGIEGIKAV